MTGQIVVERYRGHVVELLQGSGRWFVSSIVDERDRSQIRVSNNGSRSFSQALAYAKLLIDASGGWCR